MITNRLHSILQANVEFQERIDPSKLPLRAPEPLAVITCMDPRINLEALGIPVFTSQGEGQSDIRIIRTIGAMAEPRSLIIGIFLAGIREFVVLMHTDCGCCLAHGKIDTIVANMEKQLDSVAFQTFKSQIGDPFEINLQTWLKTFDDPRAAIKREIAVMRALPFMPNSIIIHGLLYDVAMGSIEVVVDGYAP